MFTAGAQIFHALQKSRELQLCKRPVRFFMLRQRIFVCLHYFRDRGVTVVCGVMTSLAGVTSGVAVSTTSADMFAGSVGFGFSEFIYHPPL